MAASLLIHRGDLSVEEGPSRRPFASLKALSLKTNFSKIDAFGGKRIYLENWRGLVVARIGGFQRTLCKYQATRKAPFLTGFLAWGLQGGCLESGEVLGRPKHIFGGWVCLVRYFTLESCADMTLSLGSSPTFAWPIQTLLSILVPTSSCSKHIPEHEFLLPYDPFA